MFAVFKGIEITDDLVDKKEIAGTVSELIDKTVVNAVMHLANDLRQALPELKGFSARNLKYMRAFAEAWPDSEFVQQPVAQLSWGRIT